ncbi:MAG: hypothetical protein ACJ79M_12080 [Myxococcales bacterium]|jgi:hypothetical protein
MLTLTRGSYEAKAQSQFIALQSQLSALATRAQETVAMARAEGERVLLAAQSKHDEALHRLELLKLAGDESWDAVKLTFETAWSELRHALGPQR